MFGIIKTVIITGVLITFLGCGGGGSEDIKTVEPPERVNEAPMIEPIVEQSVSERKGASITVVASDLDGQVASYSWSQISGTQVVIESTSSESLNFIAPSVVEDEILIFQVTVTDDQNAHTDLEVPVNVVANKLIADIDFVDDNLKACILEAAESNSWTNVDELSELTCQSVAVENLTDISDYINLISLDLADNKIRDLSELKYLSLLQVLNLSSNFFSDISPVFSLTNLTLANFSNNANIGCVSYNAVGESLGSHTSILLPEDCANIALRNIKDSFEREELISIMFEGSNDEGMILTAADSWHVQYYSYNMEDPDHVLSQYTTEGYNNGAFDPITEKWHFEYPAPDYAGHFKTQITLYCSRGDSICGGIHTQESWHLDFYFEVTCPDGEDCSFVPDAEPGSNVSNSYVGSDSPSIVRRANGDLFVVYRELSNLLSRSSDNGQTWETLADFQTSSSNDIIETSTGELLLTQNCSSSICLYRSFDGTTWEEHNLFESSNFHNCNVTACDINAFSVNSLVETQDQKFILSYSFNAGDGNKSDIYVSKSTDFVTWNSPIRVTNDSDQEFDSSLLVTADGNYLLAYNSYTNQAVVVKSSNDGVSWTDNSSIATSPRASMKINLIIDDGTPRLFFANYGNLYSSILNAQGQFDVVELIRENIPFGANAVYLPNNGIGIVYAIDLNERRDVFFENLGVVR